MGTQAFSLTEEDRRKAVNPFPATAVAVARPSGDFWSIETEALRQARQQLQDFLSRATENDKDTPGKVLAIVGDYGTGKTHIAQELLQQITDRSNSKVHPLYLDSPSDTFLALYRERFIQKLDRKEVLGRVEDYYVDAVVSYLSRSELTRPAAELIRSRQQKPEDVIESLGLMESKIQRELNERLQSVTEQPDFALALLLLRRPAFRAAVWEWLEGNPPDVALRERGIQHQIADDAAALEAIGVIAFLFGRQEHRFVLFIDEVEKVLSHTAASQPDMAAMLALKKLMEVMSRTGAMLILIGLPDVLAFLPEDARQRISAVIRPSPLNGDEVSHYIREAHRRVNGAESLDPFTPDTVEYLAEIAGGNARKMVRLCYLAYLGTGSSEETITRPILREIAREQFETDRPEDVAAEIVRTIEARGWLFQRDHVIGSKKQKHRIDYWLPIGEGGVAIGLIVSRSLLQEGDSDPLIKAAGVVKQQDTAGKKVEIVLVVSGYLADNLREPLERAFSKVLVYRARGFTADLDSVLSGLRARLEARGREDVLALIRRRVDEIARQNNSIDGRLAALAQRTTPRSELQATVAAGLRTVFGQLGSGVVAAEVQYPRVAAAFDQADRALEALPSIDTLAGLMFGIPDPILPESDIEMFIYRRHRSSGTSLVKNLDRPAGTSVLGVKAILAAFRKSTLQLLESHGPRTRTDDDSGTPRRILGYLCQTFDEFVAELDLRGVVEEIRVTHWALTDELGLNPEIARHFTTAIPGYGFDREVEYATDILKRLGRTVYDAAMQELDSVW